MPGMCAPMAVNVTVDRPVRPRDYLTEREIERLIEAAGENRWGHRDATAILIAYRHGLRPASSWRCVGTTSTSRPASCTSGEPRAARPAFTRSVAGSCVPCGGSSERRPASIYVFVSERLAPLSVAGYQRMVARAGEAARFPFLVHSHMLRHSCGYKLANDGQDTRAIQHYLGHRSITSTVRYTALAA